MMEQLVSVIIPCFNSGVHLEESLQSVLDQTYPAFECLIIDDGSEDNTAEVAQSFVNQDARFVLLTQPNAGVSAARNRGISQSRGDFIQFLDSDDIMGHEKLSAGLAYLNLKQGIDAAYSGSRYFQEDSGAGRQLLGRNHFTGTIEVTEYDRDILAVFLLRNPFVTSAPLYRKCVFERIGNYDETLRYLEDWDFQIRCAVNGIRFHYLGYHPESAIHVRLRNDSLMSDRTEVTKAKQALFTRYKELRAEYGFNDSRSGFLRRLTRIIQSML